MSLRRNPTGGAGQNYEARVAAIALARMLLGDRVPGLDVKIERVVLQSRFDGHELDDVTVSGTDHAGARRLIDYQCKRTIAPTASDAEYVETITRCLHHLRSEGEHGPISQGLHQFGLAANPTNALRDLQKLTDVARCHDRAESFVAVIRRTCRKSVRDKLDALGTIVSGQLSDASDPMAPHTADADVDHTVWQIAKGAACMAGRRRTVGSHGARDRRPAR